LQKSFTYSVNSYLHTSHKRLYKSFYLQKNFLLKIIFIQFESSRSITVRSYKNKKKCDITSDHQCKIVIQRISPGYRATCTEIIYAYRDSAKKEEQDTRVSRFCKREPRSATSGRGMSATPGRRVEMPRIMPRFREEVRREHRDFARTTTGNASVTKT
jgi:hypothetical protein